MADTLRDRIEIALQKRGWKPADLVREAASTSATVSNWMNDMVKTDHVKALQLFRIADALGVDPRWLLLGEFSPVMFGESPAPYQSQAVKSEVLTIAIQLVSEALEERGRTLPPSKQAEAVNLAYDLLDEGLPQAKVLRFVLAAVA